MAQPGVVSVAAVSRLPFSGKNLGTWVYVEGRDMPGQCRAWKWNTASPQRAISTTMGIRLRSGRLYDDRDEANPGAVMVINQAMARRLWPGEEAVGKRVKLTSTPQNAPWTVMIGVVGRCTPLRPGDGPASRGVPPLRRESAGRPDSGGAHPRRTRLHCCRG